MLYLQDKSPTRERERERKASFSLRFPWIRNILLPTSVLCQQLRKNYDNTEATGMQGGNNLSPVFSDTVAGEMEVYWTAQEEGRAEFPTPFPPLTTFSFCQKTPAENHFLFLSKHGSSKYAHFLGLDCFLQESLLSSKTKSKY